MNNARYKAYLSKLLGENVSNFLHTDPDVSRSHEQIVITQTADKDALLVYLFIVNTYDYFQY